MSRKSADDIKKQTPMPLDLQPMLATLVKAPPEKGDWLYEIKWDGFRALAYHDQKHTFLRSRNNKDFNKKFYPVYQALSMLEMNVVLDGEIVVLNKNGHPDFEALQLWRSEADGDLVFYAFDILWYDGINLMDSPLKERKELLASLLNPDGIIRNSENFSESGKTFFATAEKMGLEGIIAKRADSTYSPGIRSKDWLKIKVEKHQEAVIGGFTRNENSPKKFSSLLLGVYENGLLIPIAPVGTGFTAKMQDEVLSKLKPLVTTKCPFAVEPDFNKPSRFRPNPPKAEVTWVKPEIVAEIAYQTVAPDGSYRHPSFRGLREDKDPKQVRWETPITPDAETASLVPKPLSERKTLVNPSEETQVKKINGHDVKFTNLSKIFWPEEGIQKRDMINYYYQVAEYMLPYLKGRPQTLNRFPNGINGKSFYQKDVTGKAPAWIETFRYYSETDKREKQFVICDNEATLLYLANAGCIEINPWSSRKSSPDHPDWCIIDLDPDQNKFEQVIEAACVTKDMLDAIGVKAYCKTSGSTGLHIYIPLGGKYNFEESKEFGRALMKFVHTQLPGFTSIERLTSKRKGKLYLDFLQNRPQATVAAPYALRPKPGAPVSMPVHWDEVKKGLTNKSFTINNAISRIRETGDIFSGVLGTGTDIEKALKKLQSL